MGINDSLVVDELVLFLLWIREQLIGLRIPGNLVCVDDLGLSWVEEGLFNFIQDILLHNVII